MRQLAALLLLAACSSRPVDLPEPVPQIGSLAATNYSACVVKGGLVRGWGHNDQGQLGDGTKTDSAVPVQVRF